jgi:hypothetical protein
MISEARTSISGMVSSSLRLSYAKLHILLEPDEQRRSPLLIVANPNVPRSAVLISRCRGSTTPISPINVEPRIGVFSVAPEPVAVSSLVVQLDTARTYLDAELSSTQVCRIDLSKQ